MNRPQKPWPSGSLITGFVFVIFTWSMLAIADDLYDRPNPTTAQYFVFTVCALASLVTGLLLWFGRSGQHCSDEGTEARSRD